MMPSFVIDYASFLTILSTSCSDSVVFLPCFVAVSPKPKEHEAHVVAPGLSSVHPAVWAGGHCWKGESRVEVMEKTSPDHPSPTGTGLLMALSNLTRVGWGKRREKRSPQDGDNHFFTRLIFFQEDAMLFHEIPLLDDVLILVIVWCSILYSTLFLLNLFALPYVYILNGLHGPGNALSMSPATTQQLLTWTKQNKARDGGIWRRERRVVHGVSQEIIGQTWQLTNFQRHSFSEQSILHLNSSFSSMGLCILS